jgi:hypothetical protein
MRYKMKYPFPALLTFLLLLSSCNNEYTPKAKSYPRVNFPEHKYETFNPVDCPFRFEKPVYANAGRRFRLLWRKKQSTLLDYTLSGTIRWYD